jgi:hypothetical protein
VDRAVDGGDLRKFPRFESDGDDTLVDDRGGATTLCDEDFTF